MKYQIKVYMTKGVYYHSYKKEYSEVEEAISFIEYISPNYSHQGTSDHGITSLKFKHGHMDCNFDPEDIQEPELNIIHTLGDAPIRMPMSGEAISIVKSRLVSIEELACEALDRASYLDTKRLRRELRKELGEDHESRHSWKFDRVSQSELCRKVQEIVISLENKPRRNRKRKKSTPSGRRQSLQKTRRK